MSAAMPVRTATCSCGALRARCAGDPVRVSVCHCHACQRRTGSAFAAQLRFPEGRVTISGERSEWQRRGDGGDVATYSFCPRCGATIAYALAGAPGIVAIPLGAFAGEPTPPPAFSVYEERRLPWAEIAGEVEHSS